MIPVVDGQEVNDFALKYGITLVQGDLISAKWVANEIAVERAVERQVRSTSLHFTAGYRVPRNLVLTLHEESNNTFPNFPFFM